MKNRRAFAGILVCLVAISLGLWLAPPAHAALLPPIRLPDIDGRVVNVADLRDQVVVVTFFNHAGWGESGRAVEFMEHIWRARRDAGLRVVGVTEGWHTRLDAADARDGGSISREYMRSLHDVLDYHHVTFPIVDDRDRLVREAYLARLPAPLETADSLDASPRYCLPSTYVFDRRGALRDHRCGHSLEDASALRAELGTLLLER